MQIDGVIDKTLKRSVLKRVLVKVDPKESSNPDLHLSSAYEGYVLEEDDTTVKIYFIGTPQGIEPIQTVSKKHISPVPVNNSLKTQVCKTLLSMGIERNNPVLQQIKNLNNLEFLDSYLKQLGFDDKQLAAFYKKMCLSKTEQISEQSAQGISVGKGLARIAHKAVQSLGDIPKLYVGKKSIFNRLANFIKSFNLQDLINLEGILTGIDPKQKFENRKIYIYFQGVEGVQYTENKNPYHLIGVFEDTNIKESEVTHPFKIVNAVKGMKNFKSGEADFAMYSKKSGCICLIKDDPQTAGTYKSTEICYTANIVPFKADFLATVSSKGMRPEQIKCTVGLDERKGIGSLLAAVEPIVDIRKVDKEIGAKIVRTFGVYYADESKKKIIISVAEKLQTDEEFKKITDDTAKGKYLLEQLAKSGMKTA